MNRYEVTDIVVGTDGSDPATEAVDTAIAVAAAVGARVHPCAVVDPFPMGQRVTDVERNRQEAASFVEDAADRAREAGVEAVPEVRRGSPYKELVAHVAETDADLLVLGTHGRGGTRRVLLGSVAEAVIRTAEVPVLTVHGDDEIRDWGPDSDVLVATDGSDAALPAEQVSVDLTAALGGRLTAVSAVDESRALASIGAGTVSDGVAESVRTALTEGATAALDRVRERADERGVPLTTEILDGEAGRRIREHAATVDADLVVVGTHGRRGIRRIMLGSVAERVVRSADRPVLVVPAVMGATDSEDGRDATDAA
ncbi:universal stress protein [Halobaculum limi]|uniref:universal stress protein n=1 Tax=Halobaculum limi TaxID=3031916 RepID=UPI002406DF39|nr:universal stress protein [Halobaculum sp. YSMS11]